MRKTRWWLVMVAVLALLCALAIELVGPYWTMHQIQGAVRSGNAHEMEAWIDFPAVRQKLKADLAPSPAPGSARLIQVASNLRARSVAAAVDAWVVPERLVAPAFLPELTSPRQFMLAWTLGSDLRFQDMSHATFTLVVPHMHGKVLLARKGVSWQVVGVELPPLQSKPPAPAKN